MDRKKDENWKIVQNRVIIRALLIFLGVILMQVLAYMICMLSATAIAFVTDGRNSKLIEKISRANQADSSFMLLVSLVSASLSMIWCGILYHKSSWREKNFVYRKIITRKNIISVIGISAGGCILLTMLLTLLAYSFPNFFVTYQKVMNHLTDQNTIWTYFYVLLIGPISEELIFRGAILDRFHLAFPAMLANFLQAALFGIYHMNLVQGIYAFLLGMALGLIRLALGSIFAAIAAHILFNATSFAFTNLIKADRLIFLLLSVCSVIFFIYGIQNMWKQYKENTMQ